MTLNHMGHITPVIYVKNVKIASYICVEKKYSKTSNPGKAYNFTNFKVVLQNNFRSLSSFFIEYQSISKVTEKI